MSQNRHREEGRPKCDGHSFLPYFPIWEHLNSTNMWCLLENLSARVSIWQYWNDSRPYKVTKRGQFGLKMTINDITAHIEVFKMAKLWSNMVILCNKYRFSFTLPIFPKNFHGFFIDWRNWLQIIPKYYRIRAEQPQVTPVTFRQNPLYTPSS